MTIGTKRNFTAFALFVPIKPFQTFGAGPYLSQRLCFGLTDYAQNQLGDIVYVELSPVGTRVAQMSPMGTIEAVKAGAEDYIAKPYSQDELLARIKNFITWSRAQRHSNPLTGLPGNPSIEKEVEARIRDGRAFSFLYSYLTAARCHVLRLHS